MPNCVNWQRRYMGEARGGGPAGAEAVRAAVGDFCAAGRVLRAAAELETCGLDAPRAALMRMRVINIIISI